jgi:MFS family permease
MSVDGTDRRYRGSVVADGRTSTAPLRRNRDFVLLEAGRLLSSGGSQLTTIAYPLLVLALTHSPAKAGFVAFVRLVPHALLALLAGVAADRRPRKRLMIAADCVRALAIGSLVTTTLLHRTAFWQIALVGFVEGTGAVFFMAAHSGALVRSFHRDSCRQR